MLLNAAAKRTVIGGDAGKTVVSAADFSDKPSENQTSESE